MLTFCACNMRKMSAFSKRRISADLFFLGKERLRSMKCDQTRFSDRGFLVHTRAQTFKQRQSSAPCSRAVRICGTGTQCSRGRRQIRRAALRPGGAAESRGADRARSAGKPVLSAALPGAAVSRSAAESAAQLAWRMPPWRQVGASPRAQTQTTLRDRRSPKCVVNSTMQIAKRE